MYLETRFNAENSQGKLYTYIVYCIWLYSILPIYIHIHILYLLTYHYSNNEKNDKKNENR